MLAIIDKPGPEINSKEKLRKALIRSNMFALLNLLTVVGAILLFIFTAITVWVFLAWPLFVSLIYYYADTVVAFIFNFRYTIEIEITPFYPKNSRYPQLIIALLLPVVFLCLLLYNTSQMLSNAVYLASAVIALVPMIIAYQIFLKNKFWPSGKLLGSAFFIAIFSLLYTYDILVFTDGYFDRSEPVIYHPSVLDGEIVRGKRTSYYITLSSLGPINKPTEVTVNQRIFASTALHEKVSVIVKKGFLRMAWYGIEEYE